MHPTVANYSLAPPSRHLVLALCAAYLLFGTIGHDPWKAEDATQFGIVLEFLRGGNWLVPRVVDVPLLDNPPLYHWVASAFAQALGWALPLHDAIRLTSALFCALFLFFLHRTALLLHSPAAAVAAVLLALGTLGILPLMHETQPAIAWLAALAAAYWGLALSPARPLQAGVILGLALGFGALFGGLTPLAMGAATALGITAWPGWRSAKHLLALLVAFPIALPLAAAWPLALGMKHPDLLAAWWAQELTDLTPNLGDLNSAAQFLSMLGWYAWPAFPILAWTLWRHRRELARREIALPITAFCATLVVLAVAGNARTQFALPLIPPLVLLASLGAANMRRGAANLFDWFGVMTVTLFAGFIWLGWLAMLTGVPARLARQATRLEPGFVMQFHPLPVALAALLTFAWIALLARSPKAGLRGSLRWAAGMVLLWGLITTLWLPWIDYGKSYRGLALSLARALPQNAQCIEEIGLAPYHRASLYYFEGLRVHPPGGKNCPLLLTWESSRNHEGLAPGPGWQKIWDGHRPGDRNERFRLYQRQP
ncbi:MAG: glycosyltransferase family 39 protein [Rhodocyclaceae bacterium]|nr:glycosyltransferase family 39 protein [Rhodocyclaceae bacterium]MBX3669747.1 glycosyltransferase family 39 protein [Rhodocyclaceae bacterium]